MEVLGRTPFLRLCRNGLRPAPCLCLPELEFEFQHVSARVLIWRRGSGTSGLKHPGLYARIFLRMGFGYRIRARVIKVLMPEYTVLIVDDDAFSVHALRRCLEQSGYTVLEAKGAAECCSALQSVRPDAMVLEYRLPDGDALQLLRQVRALDAAIPVILMSAHATIDLAVRAVKQGAEHLLAKPVEPAVLLNVLSEALQNRIASHPGGVGPAYSWNQLPHPHRG